MYRGVRIDRAFGPAVENDIARTEAVVGAPLPPRFKAFLAWFLAVAPEHAGPANNFFSDWACRPDDLPDGLVPIATDPGGNLILLGVKPPWGEAVYFRERFPDDSSPDAEDPSFIARNFADSLDGLKEDGP